MSAATVNIAQLVVVSSRCLVKMLSITRCLAHILAYALEVFRAYKRLKGGYFAIFGTRISTMSAATVDIVQLVVVSSRCLAIMLLIT
jgi:hypothetical protein